MSDPAQFGEIPARSPIPQEHDDDEADAPFGQAEDPGWNGQEPLVKALGDSETVNDEENRGHDPHSRPATSGPPGHPEPHADAEQPADHRNVQRADSRRAERRMARGWIPLLDQRLERGRGREVGDN